MRTHLASVTGAARVIARRSAWPSRWLEFSALALITVVLVDCLNRPWSQPPMLAPLLAVPPALAGIGAVSVRRPLAFGAIRPLGELAARLDAGLGRGLGRHEEFVTALLVEIDPESGRTSFFNCGHPAPLLIQAATDNAAPRRVALVGG